MNARIIVCVIYVKGQNFISKTINNMEYYIEFSWCICFAILWKYHQIHFVDVISCKWWSITFMLSDLYYLGRISHGHHKYTAGKKLFICCILFSQLCNKWLSIHLCFFKQMVSLWKEREYLLHFNDKCLYSSFASSIKI